MIKKVFYGFRENIGQETIPDKEANESVIVKPTLRELNISTFSVSEIAQEPINIDDFHPQFISKKIDMLFYNKVNSRGKVLSSIVYLGEPRESWSKHDITFNPSKLYYNSPVEAAMNLQANKDFSYFNYIRYPESIDPCFMGKETEPLKTNGMPAIVQDGNTPLMDGWYTLVSAGVLVNPKNDPVDLLDGAYAQRTGHPVEIALQDYPELTYDAHWHPYEKYDNRYNIAFYVDPKFRDRKLDWYPPFVRQDFFILPRYDKVYTDVVTDYIDEQTLNNTYLTMKSKYRMISHFAQIKEFRKAQWYMQSTNLTIITHNWI